jgi:hypothetical protein
MLSRYRCYTAYSEENGKLVPAVEPNVKKEEQDKKENSVEEKLKSDNPDKAVTK